MRSWPGNSDSLCDLYGGKLRYLCHRRIQYEVYLRQCGSAFYRDLFILPLGSRDSFVFAAQKEEAVLQGFEYVLHPSGEQQDQFHQQSAVRDLPSSVSVIYHYFCRTGNKCFRVQGTF